MDRTDSNYLPEVNQGQIIDEAIHSLWADESRPVRTDLTPTSVSLTSDGTTPAETVPADATLLSTEPVQRQEGSLLSSYERGFEALTEFAVSLLLAALVARRIDPPDTRHCTSTNPFSSLLLLRRPCFGWSSVAGQGGQRRGCTDGFTATREVWSWLAGT